MDTAFFLSWIDEIGLAVAAARRRLTDLDAAIGDADHGANLDRGFSEVRQAPPGATPAEVLTGAGATLIRKVGGASGPLYGSFFRAMGKAMDRAPGDPVTLPGFATAFAAGLVAVERLGKAGAGDKTMIDALAPASKALAAAVQDGLEPADAFERAAHAAVEGAKATIPLRARKGRASYLGERSVGHEDPGAASAALIVAALTTAALK